MHPTAVTGSHRRSIGRSAASIGVLAGRCLRPRHFSLPAITFVVVDPLGPVSAVDPYRLFCFPCDDRGPFAARRRPLLILMPCDDRGPFITHRHPLLFHMPVYNRSVMRRIRLTVDDDVPFRSRLVPVVAEDEIAVVPIGIVLVHVVMKPDCPERTIVIVHVIIMVGIRCRIVIPPWPETHFIPSAVIPDITAA